MPEIRVELGERSYSIFVGKGILGQIGDLMDGAGLQGLPLFVVTDERVAQAQQPALAQFQQLPGHRAAVTIMPPGEESKSLEGFSLLLDRLAEFEGGEGAVVVALGGGAIGDLSGFVAACYKRGIPWVQAPTTLLSQVDASVGGKTAINHPRAKNLVGAFHQPRLVIADIEALSTLPPRELRSGLAEVIKHGVIADKDFFGRIEMTLYRALELDTEVLEDYAATSCRIKGAVVGEDERDTSGRRATLNYGHTFGHAIELASHFKYAHGEAIAIGMACAGDLAVRMGLLAQKEADRIEAVIWEAGLPTAAIGLKLEEVMDAMKLDKKFQQGSNRFVLAHRIGEVQVHRDIPEPMVQEVVAGRMAE